MSRTVLRLTDSEPLLTGDRRHPARQALLAEIDAVGADRFILDITRQAQGS